MDNLVQSVPDTEKWKRLVAHLAKTSVEPSNEVSVVSASPSVDVTPRKYKRRTKRVPSHTRRKPRTKQKRVKRLSSKKKTKKRAKKTVKKQKRKK